MAKKLKMQNRLKHNIAKELFLNDSYRQYSATKLFLLGDSDAIIATSFRGTYSKYRIAAKDANYH